MLRGERVLLRPVQADDLPALYRWKIDLELWGLTDEAVPRAVTYEEFLARWEKQRGREDEVLFVIELEGRTVGRCGLFAFDELSRSSKTGITIGERDAWGAGIGREALALLIGFGFRERNLRRIWLETLGTNVRAQRAYAALGFREEGRLREQAWVSGAYDDVVMMGLLRSEWDARAG